MDLYQGDIIQHAYPNGTTYHSQVIHDYDSYYNLYYAQHSTSSGGFYSGVSVRDYLEGCDSDEYFFTYQIKNGY